jgi:hypothetical protein
MAGTSKTQIHELPITRKFFHFATATVVKLGIIQTYK